MAKSRKRKVEQDIRLAARHDRREEFRILMERERLGRIIQSNCYLLESMSQCKSLKIGGKVA